MRLAIQCPSCKVRLKVEQRLLGKRVKCPGCAHPITLKVKQPKPKASAPDTKPPKKLRPDEPTLPTREEGAETYGVKPSSTRSAQRNEPTESIQTPAMAPNPLPSPRPRRTNEPVVHRERKKKPIKQKEESATDRRWLLYGALLATMIPLVFSIFTGNSDIIERLERSLTENAEQLADLDADTSMDDLINALPDQKLTGAHLSRQTWLHWVYAGVSLVGFVGFYMLLFSNVESARGLMIGSALFTATVGILLLLGFQWVAAFTAGTRIVPRGLIGLLFLVVKLIGYSYSAALEPGNGFISSMLGFTFGVGLCEEICKAIPVVVFLKESRQATWRTACLIGLASGVGFGVSEGITYSADYYNGLMGLDIYLVRFISCVALHSAWAGGAAVLMYFNQSYLPGEAESWIDVLIGIAVYMGVAIVLHGLYDTLLKQEYEIGALITAIASIGWFVFIIERIRDED